MCNKYFDNATTSFPKHKKIIKEVKLCIKNIAGSYSRGTSSDNLKIAEKFYDTRKIIANIINADKPENIIFTPNATTALNTIINGLNLEYRHVLISPLEHNSVIRPLVKSKAKFEIIKSFTDGKINFNALKKQIKKNTALLIINHVSNVNGLIQDVSNIKNMFPDIPLLVDGAQSFCIESVDVINWNIDYFVFTGHKGAGGISGTGGFYIKDVNSIPTLLFGGTGSRSHDTMMPVFSPDKFEAGTQNTTGIFALSTALQTQKPVIKTKKLVMELINYFNENKKWQVLCAIENENQSILFSVKHRTIDTAKIAEKLNKDFSITTRAGLHCSPLAHSFLQTAPTGTLRFSLGKFHKKSDINYLVECIEKTLSNI
jgi:cysteine desulfurase family protein